MGFAPLPVDATISIADKTTRLAHCAIDCVQLIVTSIYQETDHFGIAEELVNKFIGALKKGEKEIDFPLHACFLRCVI